MEKVRNAIGYRVNKVITVIKKDGLRNALKKIFLYVKAHYISKINLFSYIYVFMNQVNIKKNIDFSPIVYYNYIKKRLDI